MTPYPHQRAAIDAAIAAMTTSDRCRITMACGTGKTETAAWTAEDMNAGRIVVGVPSLNLIDQTWRRWASMFNMPPAMAVCSDEKVGREVFRVSDYGLAHTSTSPDEIALFLADPGPCVVFCTYQSAERLAVAMDNPGVAPFDFAICDEAHRLTGKGSQGAAFLDPARIRATHRTFWTATPRIVRGVAVISMDDVTQFGTSAYTYTFGEAIRDGRLSQFKIVAVQVDDPRVSDALASDKGVEDAAVVVSVAKAMRQYGLRRVISFHSLVKRAEAFANALPGVCASLPDEHRIDGVYANHIHAGTPMDLRRSELARLRSADGFMLLSNARCLGEGVDVPELDGIVFADPRTSQIEICQVIGRVIRKSDAGKVATVLIPVFIPKGMDADQAIEGGRFRPVFDVLKAMQAHDPSMSDVVVKWSERANGGGTGEAKGDEPLRFVFDGSEKMAAALSAVVVGQTMVAESWEDRFASVGSRWPHAATIADRSWLGSQRRAIRDGAATDKQAQSLAALPGWEKLGYIGKWDQHLAGLLSRWPDRLTAADMKWASGQRIAKTRGRKDMGWNATREAIIGAIPGWEWEPEPLHLKTFRQLQQVWPNTDGTGLATFCATARQAYRRGKLSPERIAQFEELDGWQWDDVANARWAIRFAEIKARWPNITTSDELVLKAARQAHAGTSHHQRASSFRDELLESLPGWEWSPRDAAWLARFEIVQARWKGASPDPRDYSWIAQHRAARRGLNRTNLTDMKIRNLESLSGWRWAPRDESRDESRAIG